ncbi:MAG: SDR family NAD(P)-dependent oxidoreductase [Gammaproteobacteria bacterium]|nr:SDR family NAD(P)-dependent oxidoreductase [Gammaproteobacteria bacterium]
MQVTNLSFDLTGRVAVVTGASSGIGAAIATALATAGAGVVVAGRNQRRLQQVVDEIKSTGGKAEAVVAELTRPQGVKHVIDAAIAAFGGIDVLVLCAGIFIPATCKETTLEDFDRQLDVNLRAPFLLSKAALPHLKPGSSIIFVTSTTARVGFANTSAYAASKGALDALMRVMAVELAPHDICVNAVSPGWTATPMNAHLREDATVVEAAIASTPAGRLAIPEDIAPSVVFLASEAARFVQGLILTVEGGYPSLPDVIRNSGADA